MEVAVACLSDIAHHARIRQQALETWRTGTLQRVEQGKKMS